MTAQPYVADIAAVARENDAFRRVVATAEHSQVVVMAVPQGGEIGTEVHEGIDQVLYVVEGRAEAWLDGQAREVGPGDLVMVPSGVEHNVVNSGEQPLKLYTVYAPPEHAPDTVHATKAEADADEHDSPPTS